MPIPPPAPLVQCSLTTVILIGCRFLADEALHWFSFAVQAPACNGLRCPNDTAEEDVRYRCTSSQIYVYSLHRNNFAFLLALHRRLVSFCDFRVSEPDFAQLPCRYGRAGAFTSMLRAL